MKFRDYDQKKDFKHVFRIWQECGWVEDEEKDKKAFTIFTSTGHRKIAELNEVPECFITTSPGKMKYGNTSLKLTAVTAVTVSRLLRKQGAASRLLASMLEQDISEGADVAGLGMFEQGYYNRFGFSTMGYEHWYTFDPAKLIIYKNGGIPVRITSDDWEEAHRCISERKMSQGFITFDSPELIHSEMLWSKNGFGLGYKKDGKLSHYAWFSTDNTESGPYDVRWMAYSNWDQFLELLGTIKSLEDQVRTVNMREPASIQLQDFIEKPFQLQTITRKSKFESRMRSIAYQQLRICNLENCINAIVYEGEIFSFNLHLTDQLVDHLPETSTFKGCAGDFTVSIGHVSEIQEGTTEGLPWVKGSINGFTRLWIGTLPASTISLTEDLSIDESLINDLEKAFYNPSARSDWDY
ncbi:MAG: GNAT family N-acetyltransferase [Spirochaetales bacterium]|nr:GNAT family N-acetyltransferase [Spirochaetales bacterium]